MNNLCKFYNDGGWGNSIKKTSCRLDFRCFRWALGHFFGENYKRANLLILNFLRLLDSWKKILKTFATKANILEYKVVP